MCKNCTILFLFFSFETEKSTRVLGYEKKTHKPPLRRSKYQMYSMLTISVFEAELTYMSSVLTKTSVFYCGDWQLRGLWVMVVVFNATFNNSSVISWWSALLVEETVGVPDENHRRPQYEYCRSLTNYQIMLCRVHLATSAAPYINKYRPRMRVKSPPRQLAPYDKDKSPPNLKRSRSHKISSSSTVYLNTKINFWKNIWK